MKGVDISHYQKGLRIRQLKADGNDFAILKLTEGAWLVDAAAFDFYREAQELGFPLGCYCYSHAVTPEDARSEAAFLLKTLNGFPMPCGIFLDMEEPKQLGLSAEKLRALVEAWCAAVRAAGYTPGVYGSEGRLWAKLAPEELPEGTLVWIAHYGRQPEIPCDLWQSGDSGHVEGYDGKVDTDEARSDRFRTLVKGSSAPPAQAPDWKVAGIQLIMRHDGYWGEVDGRKTPAFFAALRQYAADMEGG